MESSKLEVAEQQVIDMLKREDYYMLLKLRRNPEDRQPIRWNVMRTKWAILHRFDKL